MKGPRKTHVVSFKITDNQRERWTQCADDFDLSLAEYIRQTVDNWTWAKMKNESEGKTVTLNGRVSGRALKNMNGGRIFDS